MPSNQDTVFAYHERTKHHPQRFAASLGYMDWDTQPNPFRRFEGAPTTLLPLVDKDTSPNYEDLYGQTMPSQPISLQSVAAFFEHALALTAWKGIEDSRWALRCNPSSGNLHPTEGYLIADAIEGLSQTLMIILDLSTT